MKRTIVLLLALCMIFAVAAAGCSSPAPEITQEPSAAPSAAPAADPGHSAPKGDVSVPMDIEPPKDEDIDEMDAFLAEKLGRFDGDNGFEMIYGLVGMIEYDGEEYYLVSVRRMVQDADGNVTNSSRVGELVVNSERTAVYDAELTGDGIVIHFSDNLI